VERVVSAMVDRRVAVSVRGMDGLLGGGFTCGKCGVGYETKARGEKAWRLVNDWIKGHKC